MGGFEWSTIVERDKGKAVREAIGELRQWAQNPQMPEALTYFARELSYISVVLPEQADDVWMYEMTPDGRKIEGSEVTYKEYFSQTWPGEGEALLYAIELPWLWRVPSQVMAKACECFGKHGALDVWWAIVGDGTRISDLTDKAMSQFYDQVEAEEVWKLTKRGWKRER